MIQKYLQGRFHILNGMFKWTIWAAGGIPQPGL